jgi:chemosensory pili system protein ChpA (sensor histidine kinase/response regulator)
MSQQRVESRRSGLRLRTLVERVGSELAGLRSELVRTTRRSGEWDLLEKEEFTTVDVLLQQLDEALADLEESDNSLRRDLGEATAQVDIQSDKALLAQRALLDISMIPLSQIQDRLGYAVRSASRRLHKQVSFTLQGGDLVLDSRIADSLFEPLMHLINNAIDHGIEESADARLAAGKPAEGHVTIRGRATGDGVAIDVIDDGRGIDPAAIGAAALARGTVTVAEFATMTDEQIVALIWRPGFSTAAAVTAISGRGIGMKSAYDDIAALHGHIEIHSVAGQGTTLAITLPRTLAMLRVEVVREGKNLVAIPITQLVATHSVPYAELARIRPGQSVQVGNSNLAVFGITLAEGIAGDGEAGHATLLEVADKDGAIAVDEVRGSQYLPVRAAPPYLRRHVGLIGYAIGGGGQILPILDLPTLIERSIAQMTEAPRPAARMTYNILVVDDSQTMRRALRDTLSKAGFTVKEAVDGHDALDICIRQMPDLITLDMEMPGMDGLEALTALRLLPNGGSTVPVFMITSRQQARHRAAALAAGVTRYFTKPFDTDELLSATNLALADGSSQASEAAS